MAIAGTAISHEEEIGGQRRRLRLRNGEIERFEAQYAPFGVFELWDQLCDRRSPPQVRHVRDLVALALVGGGMSDTAADDLVASLPPSENFALHGVAFRALGSAFLPVETFSVKKPDGSPEVGTDDPIPSDMTQAPASATSAE